MSDRCLYIFLDEAGNLDFAPSGTKYFMVGSITKERPFAAYKDLIELKYDLAESGHLIECFHASEDVQAVRNKVFTIINKHLEGVRIDVAVVEKSTLPAEFKTAETLYAGAIMVLLEAILKSHDLNLFKQVLVFTDRIPVNKKRKAVEKAIKTALSEMLPKTAAYRLCHHDSKSNCDLQLVDYCNWAVYRKWTTGDVRSYSQIESAIVYEWNVFGSDEKK
jgi:hypothetical protein